MGLLTEDDSENIPFSLVEAEINIPSIMSFYKALGISAGSYQVSLKMCLELLGTRSQDIAVVMSVTSPPSTVSAVLRTGAHPVLVDVDPTTLQMDLTVLEEVLDELKNSVVVLIHRPGGASLPDDLEALVNSVPTIVSSSFLVSPEEIEDHLLGSFNIFDGRPDAGAGSLLFHDFADQITELRVLRSGVLGYGGDLARPLHEALRVCVQDKLPELRNLRQEIINGYDQAIGAIGTPDMLGLPNSNLVSHYLLKVLDAPRTVAHLSSYGIESKLGVYPLHYVDPLRQRWQEEPSYPVAENLGDTVVALPVHRGVLGREQAIIEKVMEVYNAPQEKS